MVIIARESRTTLNNEASSAARAIEEPVRVKKTLESMHRA